MAKDNTNNDIISGEDYYISKPSLARIMKRAGIKRINSEIYQQLRDYICEIIPKLLHPAFIFMELNDRKSLFIKDLENGCRSQEKYIAIGVDFRQGHTLKTCRSKSGNEKHYKNIKTEIFSQKRKSELLAIPKTNFRNLVKNIISNKLEKDIPKMELGFLETLQYVVENDVYELCKGGYLCCQHANRDTLMTKDLDLALLMGNLNINKVIN